MMSVSVVLGGVEGAQCFSILAFPRIPSQSGRIKHSVLSNPVDYINGGM